MRNKHSVTTSARRGFSLIELMMVVLLMTVIMGAIFQMMSMAMQRSATEQAKLDVFQQAREFMDQMARDLRQAGYPNQRNFATGFLTVNPLANDARAAVGLVKVDAGDLWFEGDVDGVGTVSSVQYHLDTSTTNNCPCLRRSQNLKIDGNPLTGQSTAVYEVEVQNVQNTAIFSAFKRGTIGTPTALPISFTADPITMATVDTIQAVLTVQSPTPDPKTGQRPITTLVTSVKLNNCSQAATAAPMSCR